MEVTDDDLAFLRRARQHYQVLAQAAERQGEARTAGTMRAQEFHAQQMLERVQGQK